MKSRRRRGLEPAFSQINVTPLVDVMLVLLVVFMITAPLLTTGVPVTLPEGSGVESAGADSKERDVPEGAAPDLDRRVVVAIDAGNRVSVESGGEAEPVGLPEMAGAVEERLKKMGEKTVYVRGHEEANYGRVLDVMGKLSAAKVGEVSLIVDKAILETGQSRSGAGE
ncbi:MAG: biopolymer transporter ExbD [Alphaproteobacteria bacterium]|nr:biopolymer transporter ExbD [Alphaproteobacteria bacterium]